MRIGLIELKEGTSFSAVKERGKYVFRVAHRAKAFQNGERVSETSALACFREPVCSVMLFWPVDTSSSATTKGDSFEGRRETAFKQHILNVFFCCSHLLCCLSFEFVSRPRATALTRLPATVSGHTVFTSLSLQLRGQHCVNTLVTIAAHFNFLPKL